MVFLVKDSFLFWVYRCLQRVFIFVSSPSPQIKHTIFAFFHILLHRITHSFLQKRAYLVDFLK